MILSWAMSILRVSTPLIFASLGGLMSERSGVINIALEGLMLIGAFTAAVVALMTHSPYLGLMAAIVAGALGGLFYAFCVLKLKANQIISGTAINLLAMGMIPLILKILYGSTGATPNLEMNERFLSFPLVLLVFICALIFALFKYTHLGLWISFSGEHPDALESAGISSDKIRWFALTCSGILASIGGASVSIYLSSGYSRNMIGGRGFMSLAAMILGRWRPKTTVLACLFFGLCDVIQMRLQSANLSIALPTQLIQIIPYLMTLIVLTGLVGKSIAPKALGK